jgi:hypothetical protein
VWHGHQASWRHLQCEDGWLRCRCTNHAYAVHKPRERVGVNARHQHSATHMKICSRGYIPSRFAPSMSECPTSLEPVPCPHNWRSCHPAFSLFRCSVGRPLFPLLAWSATSVEQKNENMIVRSRRRRSERDGRSTRNAATATSHPRPRRATEAESYVELCRRSWRRRQRYLVEVTIHPLCSRQLAHKRPYITVESKD